MASFIELAAAWRNDVVRLIRETQPYGSQDCETARPSDGRLIAVFAKQDARWNGATALRDSVPTLQLSFAKVPADARDLARPVLDAIEAVAAMDLTDMGQGGDDSFDAAIVRMDIAGRMLAAAMPAQAQSAYRSPPRSKAELARRIHHRDKAKARDIDWARFDLQQVPGKSRLWTVDMNKLTADQRERVESK